MASLAAAFGSGAMTNSIEELSKADAIFVIGSNTTEQHPLVGMRIREAVLKNDAKLLIADPRRIPLSEHAEAYAPLRPGTNLAFINGMLNVIISEGLANWEFIENRTEGFAEFKDSIVRYTPEAVSGITGVSADLIKKFARLFAEARNASIVYAMGITQHVTGSANVAALANLALVTGQIGKEASGVNPLRGQNNVQGACDMGALPNVFPGYQPVTNESVREKFKTAWGRDTACEVGMTVSQMMEEAANGKIKALFIMGENPMLSDPDMRHVEEAMEKLELLVVQDIFPTETVKYAHIVLPGTSFLEKDGTFTNTERRVQRVRKAIEPAGDSLPDWKILCMLISAFGYPADYKGPWDIMEEIRGLTPSYEGISYDRLDNNGLQWPCPTLEHPGTKFLHRDRFARGLGKFTVNEYRDPGELVSNEYPLLMTTGRIQHHYHTGTMTRRSWALDLEYPHGFIEINPVDAESLGIKDNNKVRVASRRGEIETVALITDKIKPGVVFMPFHFGETPVNRLTSRNLDPVSEIPELKVCAVRIEGVK
ncbi:MAG TPA: molybdopterin-dependent oxidoreductase [Negativicutes bacterium]|nr:molybdopterin-dependent oxidoreductase [Negativicutes bacterium]